MRMRSAASISSPTAASSAAAAVSANATLMAARRSNLRIVTRVPKFLRCLYDILHLEDPRILAWAAPDGAFFQIFDTARLEAEVLPKYFKHSKFASFQRQLNNFGFRKWTKTQSSVCTFSHHLYVQRHPTDLVELVIEHNEASNRDQQDERDDDDNDSCGDSDSSINAPVAKVIAIASPKRSPTKKRKRVVATAEDASNLLPYKTQHHASAMYAGRELSFQEQLHFSVESWDFLPVADPVEWRQPEPIQQQQQTPLAHDSLLSVKNELNSETPTSTAGLNDLPFNFTMEELDGILFTTSEPESCSPMVLPACGANVAFGAVDERYFDPRFAMSESVDTSVGFAAAPLPPTEMVDHAETTRFLIEMFAKPENEFWQGSCCEVLV